MTQTVLSPPMPVAPTPEPPAAPAEPRQRLVTLDAVRGLALLGILIVNAPFFAMPTAWADDPIHYAPGMTPADFAAWSVVSIFAAGKFISLFATLFGAGIWLMADRGDALGRSPAAIHYRRMAWLLAFGAAHAYLVWGGDILFSYALAGMVLYPLRGLSTRVQLIIALGSLVAGSAVLFGFSGLFWLWAFADPQSYAEFEIYPADEIQAEIDAYRAGPIAQALHRVPSTIVLQISSLTMFGPWYLGIMLLGMVLARTGILAGERPVAFYRNILIAGLTLGLPLTAVGHVYKTSLDANDLGSGCLIYLLNYWVAPLVGYAYAAGVVLLIKAHALPFLTAALAAVGRMALTNYLAQSLIFTFIFYGHGLGLFTTRGHADLLPLVAATWALQLIASPLWLRHFRYGPAEWLWRSLTYAQPQPMRVGGEASK